MAKVKAGEIIKARFMSAYREVMEAQGEEVLLVKSGTLSIPWVLDGEEGYINVTFSVPKGARDGEGYSGHEEAENFALEQGAKAAKKAAAEAAKAKKIARDTASRAKKKAEAEAEAE
jgi:hypothetical protein